MKEAWELFLHGGFVMWPLLVALIIAVAIAIERIAYYRQLKREMFALNDALEESEMNWQSLLTTLGSKYTANISYNLPRVLGQCQNRNVLQSKWRIWWLMFIRTLLVALIGSLPLLR